MKFGVPWNIKGVRPEVRDSARQAARRSGMSVGEWLNHVIAEQATDDDEDYDQPDNLEEERAAERAREAERAQLTERIDRLDQRIGEILAKEPAPAPVQTREVIYQADPRAFAPPPYTPPAYTPPPVYAPPPQAAAQGQWSSTLDQAVAEISARQYSLDVPLVPQQYYAPPPAHNPPAYSPPPYAPPAASMPPQPMPPSYAAPAPAAPAEPMHDASAATPPAPRFPAQDLSGLENQLRTITDLVEKLHQPKDNEEIAALRHELAEIGGKLTEAMPRRAIEALEQEMRNIAERLDESRRYGVDPAVISNMERGLVDVHHALRELKPAESLAGFEDAIRNLSFKIEQMGPASHDPAFLQQLEAAITALRGIVSHVASNDSLAMLADEMRGLSAKIERVAGAAVASGPDMSALEDKIAALTEQLRNTTGGSALPPRIESLLNSVSDRMERNELSSGEHFALGNLEDRIVALAAKLDASDARLNQLGAIERGMAELLVHIEDLRAGGLNAAPRNEIKREIAGEIAKTKESIEAVHGTVDAVVDRLALLETERLDPVTPQAPALYAPTRADNSQDQPRRIPPVAVEPKIIPPSVPSPAAQTARSVDHVPASVRGPIKSGPPPARPRTPIDPTLPPDYPLEPGSGVPRERGISAAERIAASEAALGGIDPAGTISSGSTNFIAAARRAAQAAGPAETSAKKSEAAKNEKPSGKSFSQRVRSMLAGASVILVVAGGLKLSMNLLEPGDRVAELPVATPSQVASTADDIATPIQPKPSAIPSPNSFEQAQLPPATPAEPEPQGDITASIGQQAPAEPLAISPAGDQRLVPPEKLPVALRNAAVNGDPAAAYEIAMRHLEGRGISQSLEEAARWLERSAKSGLAPAQFRLGSLYEKGQGVKKSIETAQRLYLAAAQKGNAKAMHNLAVLYAEGSQGKPDYKTAAQWFRKAADRGVADSQYNLGILYARGIGVEQNLPEAYKWFSLASAQGDKEAVKKRDDVGAKLDSSSLTAARLAAQTFTPERQPDEASIVKTPEGGWDRANASPKPAKKPRAIEPLRITPS